MASLEYVVRPYQTSSPFGITLIPSTPAQAERATLTWGATAQGTTPTVKQKATAPAMTYQFECCNEALTESSRSVHKIRIMGSDNESFIDVERPYQMKLKKNTKTQCGDSLDQISLVSQGVNAVLNDFSDQITAATSPFGTDTDCAAQWGFAQ